MGAKKEYSEIQKGLAPSVFGQGVLNHIHSKSKHCSTQEANLWCLALVWHVLAAGPSTKQGCMIPGFQPSPALIQYYLFSSEKVTQLNSHLEYRFFQILRWKKTKLQEIQRYASIIRKPSGMNKSLISFKNLRNQDKPMCGVILELMTNFSLYKAEFIFMKRQDLCQVLLNIIYYLLAHHLCPSSPPNPQTLLHSISKCMACCYSTQMSS